MGTVYHKDLTGTDLHVPKAHVSSHQSSGSDTLNHNNLGSISGGGSNDFFHVTNAQHTELLDLLNSISVVSSIVTFSNFPITPSSAPTSNYQVANKKYIDDEISSIDATTISFSQSGFVATNINDAIEEIQTRENLFDRVGTTLSPHFSNDSVDLGSGNFTTTGDVSSDSLILTADPSIISSANNIDIKPNGDAEDFLRFTTSSDIPYIDIRGGNSLYLTSSGSTSVGLFAYEDATHYGYWYWQKPSDVFSIGSTHEIRLEPSGDTGEYVRFSTTSNVPEISAQGVSTTPNLKITSEGGTIDFDNDNIITSGSISIKSQNELRFYDNGNYVGFEAPALSADKIWVLPSADGSANEILKTDGAGTLSWVSNGGAIQFVMDGGGSAISTGAKSWILVPFDCTITSWDLTVDTSATITIDVWKDTYANFPPDNSDTICGGNEPAISATTKATDSTLTSWTTTISANDYIRINVDANDNATLAVLTIKVTKT